MENEQNLTHVTIESLMQELQIERESHHKTREELKTARQTNLELLNKLNTPKEEPEKPSTLKELFNCIYERSTK